jgi:hypothetical protein
MNMQQQPPKKIKICKYCRSEIDRKAKICPFCRKKQGESCLSVIIFVALVLGFWMFVANGIFNDDKDNSSTEAQPRSNISVEEETQPTTESIPLGQLNALNAAKGYLNIMPFSAQKLLEQLEFEGYSHDDAVYGVSNCGADWNQQAAQAAKDYLNLMSFSKEKLIEQLEFDGYTHDQAVYGVSAVGY